MKSNKIVTIEHLSDMKLFPIHDLNKENNYNCCVYGKSNEGKIVDVIKITQELVEQKNSKA